MAHVADILEASETSAPARPSAPLVNRRRLWIWIAALGAPLIWTVVVFLNCPLTESALIDALQKRSMRQVTIGHFSRTFFPPGCVVDDVQFLHRKHKEKTPLIQIRQIILATNYVNILTLQDRLSVARVVDMHITIPPSLPGVPNPVMPLTYSNDKSRSVIIDKLIADGSTLDFVTQQGAPRYRLIVDKLRLDDLGNNRPMAYKTVISNQTPPGKIRSTGVFGTWNPQDPGSTPLHGNFTFDQANLSVFGGISGILSSNGIFQGTLSAIDVHGFANVPDFKVASANHQRQLAVRYHAVVNGTNGDVALNRATGVFDHTTAEVQGSIAGNGNAAGKTASLDLWTETGHVEDVLRLFVSDKVAPMSGTFRFAGHLVVPPGPLPFVQRVKLTGDFGVGKGKFANRNAEDGLTRLSDSAEKHTQPNATQSGADVLSDLQGRGVADNGLATLSDIGFSMPGAKAKLHGTFSLLNYKVDLHGKLVTTGRPSQATTGMRAFMLKLITPMFKKKHSVDVVPFKITGSSSNLDVALDMAQPH